MKSPRLHWDAMAWEPLDRPLFVTFVTALLVSTTVPAAGSALTAAPSPTLEDGSALTDAGAASTSWQQAPASPAAMMAWGIGASQTTALLSTTNGTFVSTDDARTWSQVSDPTVDEGDIAFDPDDPDVGYVAGFGGVVRTTDGGQSFDHIVDADNVRVIAVAPDGTLAIGVGDDDFNMEIQVSEDQGDSWQTIDWPGDQYTLQGLAFADSAEDLVVMSLGTTWVTHDGGDTWTIEDEGARALTAEADGTLWRAGFGPVEKSTDAGDTWESVDTPATPDVLTPRPGGGVFGATSEGVITTEDGTSWTNMGFGSIALAATGLDADPNDPDAVLMSDESIGAGWLGPADEGQGFAYEGRSTGLPPVPVTTLDVAPDGSTLVAGSSHGVYATEPGSEDISHTGGALGMPYVNTVAAASGGDVLYAGGQNFVLQAYIEVSRDGGDSWQTILPVSQDSNTREIVVDPEDPERAWAAVWVEVGSDRVYETNDAGETWEPVLEIPHVQASNVASAGLELTDIAYDEREDQVLAATSGGVLAYDPSSGLPSLVGANPANTVDASSQQAYADGPLQSVWSDAGDPSGMQALLAPWADTGASIDELVSVTTEGDHVVTRAPSGAVDRCTPSEEDSSGTCEGFDLPAGSATALAAGPAGELWSATEQHGLYHAQLP